MKIISMVQNLFTKHLLLTNTLTCSGLLGLGDLITQRIENRNASLSEKKKINWQRTGRMAFVGIMLGPFGHVWYSHVVDKLVTTAGRKGVIKKILADQLVAGPFFSSAFFFVMGMLEGRGTKGGIEEVKEKFLTVYLIDWCVWPPAQYVNFSYVPVKYRMLYVSMITLCWNVILSYIKHKDMPHKVTVKNTQ